MSTFCPPPWKQQHKSIGKTAFLQYIHGFPCFEKHSSSFRCVALFPSSPQGLSVFRGGLLKRDWVGQSCQSKLEWPELKLATLVLVDFWLAGKEGWTTRTEGEQLGGWQQLPWREKRQLFTGVAAVAVALKTAPGSLEEHSSDKNPAQVWASHKGAHFLLRLEAVNIAFSAGFNGEI